jgi:hypothetical protein
MLSSLTGLFTSLSKSEEPTYLLHVLRKTFSLGRLGETPLKSVDSYSITLKLI